jgi:hypothetical protein
MYNRNRTPEHHINRLIVYEKRPKSNLEFLPFRRKTFRGQNSVLFIVNDPQNKNRAKMWCSLLHKLYHTHAMASNSLDPTKIRKYIDDHKIVSVLLLNLSNDSDKITISTENESIYSFLTRSFSFENLQYTVNQEDVQEYPISRLTTLFTIGQNVNLTNFFSFLTSFLQVHTKLSSEHKESRILALSEHNVRQNIPYNRVELHPTFLLQNDLQENDFAVIYNPFNYKYSVANVKSSSKIAVDEIIASPSIKNKLELWIQAKIVIHPVKKIISQKIQIQDVSKLADGNITVSEDIYQLVEEMGAEHYEVVNRATSASIDITRSEIIVGSSLAPGTIRMSYLQREFLDFEHPPDTLPPFYFQLFKNASVLNQEQVEFLNTHYSKGRVHQIDTYEEKLKAKKILQNVGYNRAVIYPLPLKRNRKQLNILKRPFQFFLHWSIRPSSLKLKVIRPYSTDESSNIVRISKSVMSVLGVAENDLIQLAYRGRFITVPVLELDSTQLIKETNIICNESTINISIGIPAHLRHKLGIKQIGKICTVERDLKFLYRKNWNTQFLPILATIFTIYSLKIDDLWLKILMMVIIIPISSYITLSPVREKIPKI